MSKELYAVADFCLIPIGTGNDASVSEYIAECARVLDKSGLKYQMHGYGTNLEGPWSAVSQAIHDCHAAVHAKGAPRIATDIRIGTRDPPRPSTSSTPASDSGENARKLRRVQEILGREHVGSAGERDA
ncbi:hypothetical protein FA95DRAFT_1567113 [Auriscalpium vulgare]|uniref:Uncharacterized protein n=1 Tax=Auriscalpium vulgare TaxID=40419 RepID=A0ACB8R6P7_9AGAM|nr:hypothetical protein FA95DRAFT_1567113 [Auriscalpium vulgare]